MHADLQAAQKVELVNRPVVGMAKTSAAKNSQKQVPDQKVCTVVGVGSHTNPEFNKDPAKNSKILAFP